MKVPESWLKQCSTASVQRVFLLSHAVQYALKLQPLEGKPEIPHWKTHKLDHLFNH